MQVASWRSWRPRNTNSQITLGIIHNNDDNKIECQIVTTKMHNKVANNLLCTGIQVGTQTEVEGVGQGDIALVPLN